MKESYRKDPASHPGPESYACRREAPGEALTGEDAGTVLSCENTSTRTPTPLCEAEGNITGRDQGKRLASPAQSETRRTALSFENLAVSDALAAGFAEIEFDVTGRWRNRRGAFHRRRAERRAFCFRSLFFGLNHSRHDGAHTPDPWGALGTVDFGIIATGCREFTGRNADAASVAINDFHACSANMTQNAQSRPRAMGTN